MIVPFKYSSGPAKPVLLTHAKQHLTDTVCAIFADRPRIDLVLAISTGHRALERGTPFFEAVEAAEGVISGGEEIVALTRELLVVRRNRERLTAYRIKRRALLEL